MQSDTIARAVEGHVERSRSGRHGVDRAATAGRRELNDVGEPARVNADSLALRL